jgi:hypothetical protein
VEGEGKMPDNFDPDSDGAEAAVARVTLIVEQAKSAGATHAPSVSVADLEIMVAMANQLWEDRFEAWNIGVERNLSS